MTYYDLGAGAANKNTADLLRPKWEHCYGFMLRLSTHRHHCQYPARQHGSTQQGRADIFDDLFESEGRLGGLGFLLLPSCDIEHPGVSDLSQHEAGLADTNN